MRKPKVCLCTPYYGQIEHGNACAVLVQASDNKVDAQLANVAGSLLAYNFNRGWAVCLQEGGYDYFLLVHSDVVPEPNWLDVMIERIEKYNLDALHVALAIKDSRGITSTAVGTKGQEYGKVRRITMHELQELPEVFTERDVVRLEGQWPENPVMCCNTGMLILRLGDRSHFCGKQVRALWKQMPGWTIKDKITCVTDDGEYDSWELDYSLEDDKLAYRKGDSKALVVKEWNARVVPEDWGFGHWCAVQGLRVGGTRMNVGHVGPMMWPNNHAWGSWKQDEYYTKAS